jgi:hypothetical protein
MAHVVIFDILWSNIYKYLVSSAPSDGRIYEFKFWVVLHVTEPVLEVMYRCAFTTYKPIAAYTPEDLL